MRQANRKIAQAERQIRAFRRQRGEAKLDAEKRQLDREIAAAERDVNRFKRQRAEAKLDADAGPANRATENASGRVRRFGREKAEAKLTVDDGPAQRSADQASARVKGFGREKAEATIDVNNQPAMNAINTTANKVQAFGRMTATATLNARDSASGTISSVRSSLNNLDGQTATTYIRTVRTGGGAAKATGGPIIGPGSGTSDDIPIWASNGEHMWTAREVANAGGHAAVEAMRAQFRYAAGGPVGYDQASVLSQLTAASLRQQVTTPVVVSTRSSRPTAAAAVPTRQVTFTGDIQTVDVKSFFREAEQRERDAVALMGSS